MNNQTIIIIVFLIVFSAFQIMFFIIDKGKEAIKEYEKQNSIENILKRSK